MTKFKIDKTEEFLTARKARPGEIVDYVPGSATFIPADESRHGKAYYRIKVRHNGQAKNWNLNKTTTNRLIEAFGEDDDKWPKGAKIQLQVEQDIIDGKPQWSLYGLPIVEPKKSET